MEEPLSSSHGQSGTSVVSSSSTTATNSTQESESPSQTVASRPLASSSSADTAAHSSQSTQSRNIVPEVQPTRFSTSDMQPPPPKRQRLHNYDRRPRLSICPSVSPDAELVEDRDRNDNTLKGKFEAIFEKYGRDFTDVGDEINVMTGEVIVDNGHILSMQDEKDPGSPSRARPRVSRDPTEMPSVAPISRSATVGAEDVIASIEIMARRVATGQTPYPDDGEDAGEEFYESGEEEFGEEMLLYHGRTGSVSSDSLFGDDYQDDWDSPRSRDSLLGCDEPNSSIESFYEEHAVLPPLPISKSESGSREEPVVLTSGPISARASVQDLEVLGAGPAISHGHPVSAGFQSPSPPAFVKSNGKAKVVAKKFNVSRAYEELLRKASATPSTSKPGLSQKESSARPKPLKKPKAAPKRPQESKPPIRDTKTILKRLPVARPSSEPRTLEGDYESDDPLQ